jgi:membrane-bound serine protease (ClpP class)
MDARAYETLSQAVRVRLRSRLGQPVRSGPRSTWMGRETIVLSALICLGWIFSDAHISNAQSSTVLLSSVKGPITPVIADHIGDGVDRAKSEGHQAFLVELDTPGGLDTSMRDIVQAFLTSEVPIVIYVAPDGARAASAGALITLASHIAAMAPGTAIGAATPVDLEGSDVSEKIINDAAAYAESIAEARNRNVNFAIDTVREARSATAREAVDIGAVDLLAPSRTRLLQLIDGAQVVLADGSRPTLRTGGAGVVVHDLGVFRQLLQWLADPNLAFLFMSLGTLAVIYELANPGVGLGGIVGVILLLLGLAALSVLPVNAVGVILLVLAAALFVAELFAPGIGVFAAGGVGALMLSGVFLFRGGIEISPSVLLPTGLVAGAGAVLAGRLVARSHRTRSISGKDAIVGRKATVQRHDGIAGEVNIDGTWWRARTHGKRLTVGETVQVIDMDGLDLIVEPEEETQ